MIHIHHTNHNPIMCALAIAGPSVIYVDLETTGLHDHDHIVAAGVLVGHDAHIIITDQHRDISSLAYQVSLEDLRLALSPLGTRPDLIAVFHNAVYDVAMLERAGIRVNCIVHDTWKLLKLRDSDRGPEMDEETGIGTYWPRWERRFNEPMSYKLKAIARHLLGIDAIDFPGNMTTTPSERARPLPEIRLVGDTRVLSLPPAPPWPEILAVQRGARFADHADPRAHVAAWREGRHSLHQY